MASNEYHYVTHWRVPGTAAEIEEILSNAPDLTRWWPSVYLDVQELRPGDASGVGRVVDLYTKGWLPYTLRWQFRVTEVVPGQRMALEAWGDFVGRGVWTFRQDGDWVDVTYDWKILAEKPLLRALSFALKPIFGANHQWAMRMGERSLLLELQRRHTLDPAAHARIPAPPGPTPTSPLPLLLGTGLAATALVLLLAALRRPRR